MSEKEPEETVDDLEERGEKLGEEIEETRDDWERKQESSAVPGAVPDPDPDEVDLDPDDAPPPDDG